MAGAAMQGALAATLGLWVDALTECAGGNLDVASASQWGGAFAAEAVTITGAIRNEELG